MAAMLKGARERDRRAHNASAWAVWHGAKLAAYPPQDPKQFVKLEKLQIRPTVAVRDKRRNAERLYLMAAAWAGRGRIAETAVNAARHGKVDAK